MSGKELWEASRLKSQSPASIVPKRVYIYAMAKSWRECID